MELIPLSEDQRSCKAIAILRKVYCLPKVQRYERECERCPLTEIKLDTGDGRLTSCTPEKSDKLANFPDYLQTSDVTDFIDEMRRYKIPRKEIKKLEKAMKAPEVIQYLL